MSGARGCARPAAWPASAHAATLQATTEEPRAFGYQVGDVVQRRIIGRGARRPGARREQPAAPRRARHGVGVAGVAAQRVARAAQRLQIELDYQVFLSPADVRTLETAGVDAALRGHAARAGTAHRRLAGDGGAAGAGGGVAAHAAWASCSPNAAPPLIDTRAQGWRLLAYAALLAALLAYLAVVYLGLPWWGAQRRPFALAWRQLNRRTRRRGARPASACMRR